MISLSAFLGESDVPRLTGAMASEVYWCEI